MLMTGSSGGAGIASRKRDRPFLAPLAAAQSGERRDEGDDEIVAGLYVIGGQQRAARPLSGGDGWYEYQKGLILRVEPETGSIRVELEYTSPPEACPDEDPAILFKSGTVQGDRLYLCTQTEVLVYRLPEFQRIGYVSLPLFNDLHHVRPTPEGHLLVANTGLDMVLEVTLDGRVLREWSVLDADPWERFSRAVDYRKVKTTKPHHAHPNQVFYIGNEVWATRFEQKDAICLTSPGRRIDIGVERLHDGLVHGGKVYFTAVNGKIVVADAESLRVEEVIDLTDFHDRDTLLGWTRGIMVEDDGIWIGFSRLRPTKFRENVGWVMRGFRHVLPTRIARYDIRSRRCTASIDLEQVGLSAVFSILPVRGL